VLVELDSARHPVKRHVHHHLREVSAAQTPARVAADSHGIEHDGVVHIGSEGSRESIELSIVVELLREVRSSRRSCAGEKGCGSDIVRFEVHPCLHRGLGGFGRL
jgi:hypothetical protein